MSTTVSATVGLAASVATDTVPGSAYLHHWTIWWVGDMMGDLLVASLLLVWARRWVAWHRSRAIES